ncbi:hypothetical protein WJX73_000761 [Symbiochloris irregularis]|uniref:Uncharacterized protein n=1 Tax=Symbiochloris irregularis TaxID=706552 RepID=A0AAW1NPS3_9CHLO
MRVIQFCTYGGALTRRIQGTLLLPRVRPDAKTFACVCASDSGAQPPQQLQRRDLIAACLIVPLVTRSAGAAELPAEPRVGACIDCIGEVNGDLNACEFNSASCISTQNDDEAHFVAPWTYDSSKKDAVSHLIDVATGETLGASPTAPLPISALETPKLVLEGVFSTLRGVPRQPRQAQQRQTEPIRFRGRLQDRHSTPEGCEYVRITLMADTKDGKPPDAGNVIDAEFLFPSGDSIVDIRAASRGPPGLSGGSLAISLSDGLVYDQNVARRLLEELRKSLRFGLAPVLTEFDQRFNQEKPFWFEKLYEPFLFNRRDKVESQE